MAWYIGVTFLGAVGSLIIFLCALKRGLFEDIEEVKYQMFHEDEQCPNTETRSTTTATKPTQGSLGAPS